MPASPTQVVNAALQKALTEVQRALKITTSSITTVHTVLTRGLVPSLKAVANAAAAATVAGAAFAAVMKEAMSHWNPAAVIRFEQRLGDLLAVVGSLLAPAFQELTEDIHSLSNWLYNLSPHTKMMISSIARAIIPITAIAVAFGALIAVLRPLAVLLMSIGRLVGVVGGVAGLVGGLAGNKVGEATGMSTGGKILATIIGIQIGRAIPGAFAGFLAKYFGPKMFMGIPLPGQGIGFAANLGRFTAAAGRFGAAAATNPYAWLAAGVVATAAGGSILVDTMSQRGRRDPFTFKMFGEAMEDFGSGGARPSLLSADRRKRNDDIVNAARMAKGLNPLDASGKVVKDTTGLDAARRATTMTSVVDVGRRMREAALTNAGRLEDPNLRTASAAELIRDMLIDLIPKWARSVEMQQAIDQRNQVAP